MSLGVKAADSARLGQGSHPCGPFSHAVPTFFVQLLMLLLFGYYWPIMPIHGTMSAPPPVGAWPQFVDKLWHLVLPVTSNMIVGFGSWALYARNTMIEALGQDSHYHGAGKGNVRKRCPLYALRSVLLPIVTLLFMSLPGMVSGLSLLRAFLVAWGWKIPP